MRAEVLSFYSCLHEFYCTYINRHLLMSKRNVEEQNKNPSVLKENTWVCFPTIVEISAAAESDLPHLAA